MNLWKRLERLEKQMVTPEDFEEVWDRMWARTRLRIRKRTTPEHAAEIERSPECQWLLAEDTDELRRADQNLWQKHQPSFDIPGLFADDGALIIPIATRIE